MFIDLYIIELDIIIHHTEFEIDRKILTCLNNRSK